MINLYKKHSTVTSDVGRYPVLFKQKNVLVLVLLTFIFSVSFSRDQGFNAFVITDSLNATGVQSCVYIYQGPRSSTLPFDSLEHLPRESFAPIDSVKNVMVRDSVYWAFLWVNNSTGEGKYMYLVAGITQHIDMYERKSDGRVEQSRNGYSVPDAQKKSPELVSEVVGFYILPGESKRMFFRVKSELNLKLDPLFKIQERQVYHDYMMFFNLLQGLFHGTVWMMVAYALFMYIHVRDKIFLYYILYSVSFSLAILTLLGYTRFYIFPRHGFNVLYSELIIQIGSVFYSYLFMYAVDIANVSRRMYRFMKLFIAFSVAGVFLSVFFLLAGNFYWYNHWSQIAVFVELVVFMGLIILLIPRRNSITKYIIIGNIFFTAGALVIVVALLFFGEPFIRFFPAFQAGISIELLFFTFALSKRNQHIENQKREADKLIIEQLQLVELMQREQNEVLEQKVMERTQEILQSKEEIIQQQEHIKHKSRILEKTNRQLTENLEYAGFIQNALMHDITTVKSCFADSMLLYQPMSYVSGDFYMFYPITQSSSLLIVADCTGHGVPGAILTIISQGFLDEIIVNQNIIHPEKILKELEFKIKFKLLKSSRNAHLNEGLDIGVMFVDKEMKQVLFAGARLSLIHISNNALTRIKGDKRGIGGIHRSTKHAHFTLNTLEYREGDEFYMFTDGFQDQLNGLTNEKFKSKKFKALLLSNAGKAMSETQAALRNEFQAWQGTSEQTDDLLVLGIRL